MASEVMILGAGPAGLGAAWRLQELHFAGWEVLEACAYPGGLSASFVDVQGFTWDIGGHIQHSHYEYFDRAMDEFLGRDGWLHHERQSWVWLKKRFIPYPFQNNLHRLPRADLEQCVAGLMENQRHGCQAPKNFREWILATFGQGIAEIFLLPYNFKVWGYAPDLLNSNWVGDRVAVPDLKRLLQNVASRQDDVAWGPNNQFRFPVRGGTGAVWRACAARLPRERLHFNTPVSRLDLRKRTLRTAMGQTFLYDRLISTIPLRELIRLSGQSQFEQMAEQGLLYSSSHIFGIGLKGLPPEEMRSKCWIYFPESNCPFYRVTVFSNYSPENVPAGGSYWSLMAEVSESAHKPVHSEALPEEVLQGLLATGLIKRREDIVSTWRHRAIYGYPTPGLERDRVLAEMVPFFEQHGVYPRGRFGLWKYEVGNQDHAFMQGVEVVERLLNGRTEITARDANLANRQRHPWPFELWK